MNRLTQAQLRHMYRFWLMHLIIVCVGMITASVVSLVWVVPRLYHHLGIFFGTFAVYLLFAYLVIPRLWYWYERYLVFQTYPGRTQTHAGIPADPLNIGMIGSTKQVTKALLEAGWVPADPITLRSSFRIAASVLLKHPYRTAPMSALYLLGRKQDLAFERESGDSAAQRHHVRLWRTKRLPGRGWLWMGAASFDKNTGLSHLTGQLTHHIDSYVDIERNRLIKDLRSSHRLRRVSTVVNQQLDRKGKNAGGDQYFTDGAIKVAILA